jgi:hypothetical protein
MTIWDILVKGDSEIQGDQTKISEELCRILDLLILRTPQKGQVTV